MMASALVLGVLGLVTTFAPDWVLGNLEAPVVPALLLLTQVLGALYVGFAGLNWMARDNLIGGVYSRPVAIGNLMHFLVGSLAMLKLVTRASELRMLWLLAVIYTGFALLFTVVLFCHPVRSLRAG